MALSCVVLPKLIKTVAWLHAPGDALTQDSGGNREHYFCCVFPGCLWFMNPTRGLAGIDVFTDFGAGFEQTVLSSVHIIVLTREA